MKKQQENDRYELKSHLETWDEVPDDELNDEIESEVKEEVCFNVKNKLLNPQDFDISVIIEAQANAIIANRKKNLKIQEAFNRIRDHSPFEMRTKERKARSKERNDGNFTLCEQYK